LKYRFLLICWNLLTAGYTFLSLPIKLYGKSSSKWEDFKYKKSYSKLSHLETFNISLAILKTIKNWGFGAAREILVIFVFILLMKATLRMLIEGPPSL